jgi:septal ring factor EnvC (AmiA/AmiB activator)
MYSPHTNTGLRVINGGLGQSNVVQFPVQTQPDLKSETTASTQKKEYSLKTNLVNPRSFYQLLDSQNRVQMIAFVSSLTDETVYAEQNFTEYVRSVFSHSESAQTFVLSFYKTVQELNNNFCNARSLKEAFEVIQPTTEQSRIPFSVNTNVTGEVFEYELSLSQKIARITIPTSSQLPLFTRGFIGLHTIINIDELSQKRSKKVIDVFINGSHNEINTGEGSALETNNHYSEIAQFGQMVSIDKAIRARLAHIIVGAGTSMSLDTIAHAISNAESVSILTAKVERIVSQNRHISQILIESRQFRSTAEVIDYISSTIAKKSTPTHPHILVDDETLRSEIAEIVYITLAITGEKSPTEIFEYLAGQNIPVAKTLRDKVASSSTDYDRLTQVTSAITSLEKERASITVEMSKLDTNTDNKASVIAQLNTNKTFIYGEISDIESEITANNQSVAELQNRSIVISNRSIPEAKIGKMRAEDELRYGYSELSKKQAELVQLQNLSRTNTQFGDTISREKLQVNEMIEPLAVEPVVIDPDNIVPVQQQTTPGRLNWTRYVIGREEQNQRHQEVSSNKVTDCMKTIGVLEAAIATTQAELSHYEKLLTSLKQESDTIATKIADLKDQINTLNSSISALQINCIAIDTQIANLEREILKIKAQSQTTVRQTSAREQEMYMLTTKVSQLQSLAQKLTVRINARPTYIQNQMLAILRGTIQ